MVFILHIAHWLMYFHNAHCILHFTFCKLHLAQGCEAGKLPDWFAWLSQSGDHSHGEVQMVSWWWSSQSDWNDQSEIMTWEIIAFPPNFKSIPGGLWPGDTLQRCPRPPPALPQAKFAYWHAKVHQVVVQKQFWNKSQQNNPKPSLFTYNPNVRQH